MITLECDEKKINFYKKYNFKEKGKNEEEMMTMIKNID